MVAAKLDEQTMGNKIACNPCNGVSNSIGAVGFVAITVVATAGTVAARVVKQ